MFDDILFESDIQLEEDETVCEDEEEIVLYDADEQEAFEEKLDDIAKRFMSDDEDESDKAFEDLMNI